MPVYNGLKAIMNIEKKEIDSVTKSKIGIQELKAGLAKYCGVSQHNIEQIYKGYSLPSLEVALKIAKFYGVSVDDIFSLSPEVESE
ncbi:DNA-binding protein [Bacillus phage Mater]|uniref:DNA-binding protein n=1 Tax=Bacillus phage Mater TaxID=1540090 RepID=A0A0A0RMJ6_9CAUD|nr:HTH DNA binding protein [Bacillus phage Mater]AIW03187.1 DNA-binding protein [Bacillus phage Mater]